MGVADGGGEGDPAVVPPVAATMATAPEQAVDARIVAVPAEMLDCHACLQPLKPPIYKCDADHRVCGSTCRGVHAEACSRPAAHSRDFDAFAAAATVLCDYEGYGCRAGGLVYHLAADHCRACPHAPCGCPERGCGFFGSRQMLLSHVSGPDHSRPVLDVRYGQPRKLSLPLSRRWYLLVGEEDRAAAGTDPHRNVFLVSVGEGATTAVSVVCVRADGGAPGAPQFSCRLAVEHPGDGTMVILESPMMSSSSLSAGAPTAREVRALPVLQSRQEDNEERKRKTQQGDTDLTWKTSPTKRGKNHGRQPAKLHYIEECLQTPGISQMQLSQPAAYKGFIYRWKPRSSTIRTVDGPRSTRQKLAYTL